MCLHLCLITWIPLLKHLLRVWGGFGGVLGGQLAIHWRLLLVGFLPHTHNCALVIFSMYCHLLRVWGGLGGTPGGATGSLHWCLLFGLSQSRSCAWMYMWALCARIQVCTPFGRFIRPHDAMRGWPYVTVGSMACQCPAPPGGVLRTILVDRTHISVFIVFIVSVCVCLNKYGTKKKKIYPCYHG